jgi:DNA-binding response OmpR family regulator
MFEKWKKDRSDARDVLAITASEPDRIRLQRILEDAGWRVFCAKDLKELDRAPSTAIVLYDRDLPGIDWRDAIRRLAARHACIILASFVVDDYLWEEVIRCGGYDVLAKPFREEEVTHTVRFAAAALTRSLPSAPRTE